MTFAAKWTITGIASLAAGLVLGWGVYTYAAADTGPVALVVIDAGPSVAAVPAPLPPDPVADPSGFFDEAKSAFQSGGWLSALLLGLYGVALVLRRWIPALRRGRTAVVVASVIAALTAVVTAIQAGQAPTLSLLINAALAGLLLYLRPDLPSQPTIVLGDDWAGKSPRERAEGVIDK